jgi:hypothetical protein
MLNTHTLHHSAGYKFSDWEKKFQIQIEFSKEYFPNLLVNLFWGQIFVFQVRDLKIWLFAYFLILLSCAKFHQDWTTLILEIL